MGRALSSRCSTKARFSPRDRAPHGGSPPDWMISDKPGGLREWCDESDEMIKVGPVDLVDFFWKSKTEHCSDVHNGWHIVGTDILAVRLRPIWHWCDQTSRNCLIRMMWMKSSKVVHWLWWCPSESPMDYPRCSELKSPSSHLLIDLYSPMPTTTVASFKQLGRQLFFGWDGFPIEALPLHPSQHLLDFQGTCFKAKLFGKPGMIAVVAMGVIGSWEVISFWNRNIKTHRKYMKISPPHYSRNCFGICKRKRAWLQTYHLHHHHVMWDFFEISTYLSPLRIHHLLVEPFRADVQPGSSEDTSGGSDTPKPIRSSEATSTWESDGGRGGSDDVLAIPFESEWLGET